MIDERWKIWDEGWSTNPCSCAHFIISKCPDLTALFVVSYAENISGSVYSWRLKKLKQIKKGKKSFTLHSPFTSSSLPYLSSYHWPPLECHHFKASKLPNLVIRKNPQKIGMFEGWRTKGDYLSRQFLLPFRLLHLFQGDSPRCQSNHQ